MLNATAQALATLRDYVERSTHWKEGGADRHAAKLALRDLDETSFPVSKPVGSVLNAHLNWGAGPWCKEALLYSPDNHGDHPENRVMLYTAGRLDDALEWADKGIAEWRAEATSARKQASAARASARVAIGHLQAVLNYSRTHAAQQAADTAARDWLESIGNEADDAIHRK